jgi:hypothetical protein
MNSFQSTNILVGIASTPRNWLEFTAVDKHHPLFRYFLSLLVLSSGDSSSPPLYPPNPSTGFLTPQFIVSSDALHNKQALPEAQDRVGFGEGVLVV